MLRYLSLIALMCLVSSCCSRTTLVLLPDEDDSKSGVVMQTESGEVELTQPYETAQMKGRATQPPEKGTIEPEEFARKWGKLEAVEPMRPQSFTLYFFSGSIELTEDSTATLPEVIAAMQQEGPVEVNIIGHSDAVGNEEYNYRLSLERAKVVHEMLITKAPRIKRTFIQSHGENDPLVPTADNVAEPRNRRVEILIR